MRGTGGAGGRSSRGPGSRSGVVISSRYAEPRAWPGGRKVRRSRLVWQNSPLHRAEGRCYDRGARDFGALESARQRLREAPSTKLGGVSKGLSTLWTLGSAYGDITAPPLTSAHDKRPAAFCGKAQRRRVTSPGTQAICCQPWRPKACCATVGSYSAERWAWLVGGSNDRAGRARGTFHLLTTSDSRTLLARRQSVFRAEPA
jgi:hypothetical protein